MQNDRFTSQTQYNFSFVNFLRTVSIIIWRMTTEEIRCRTRWPFFRRWILIYSSLLYHTVHSIITIIVVDQFCRYYCCRCSFDRKKASGFLFQPFGRYIVWKSFIAAFSSIEFSSGFWWVRFRQRKAFARMKFHRIRSRWVFASVNRTELNCRMWDEKIVSVFLYF